MSRTFRLQNLPKLGGGGRKYVDGFTGGNKEQQENRMWYHIAHQLLGIACNIIGQPIECVSHEWCIPRKYFTRPEITNLFDKLERDTPYDVTSVHYHPWVSYTGGRNSRRKRWRTHGNRVARRVTKQILRRDSFDPDGDGLLPTNKETIDRWGI